MDWFNTDNIQSFAIIVRWIVVGSLIALFLWFLHEEQQQRMLIDRACPEEVLLRE